LACSLYVWLTEDNIVSAQYFPDSTTNNYLRNHLLRDAIAAPNGDPLTLPADENVTRTFQYTLPEKVVPKNCHIIAALYANGEIIQATQANATIE
ncbi:MAG: Omp28-related outer membrane protein, partial [Paludibacteraceae bacterium]